jgi:hypothetical protein
VPLRASAGVVDIAAGDRHSLALLSNGSIIGCVLLSYSSSAELVVYLKTC